MARILIEVIYEQITQNPETMNHESSLRNHLISFENENRDVALADADVEFNKIRTEGMYLQGGAVLKSLILPSAVKQIGLVDLDLFETQLDIESGSTPIPSDVPPMAESAQVGSHE